MSVWEDMQALHDYVYRSAHVRVMARRKEWFDRMPQSHMVLWWVPAGHRPSLEEARDKLRQVRAQGPTPGAFTFKQAYPAPAAGAAFEDPSPVP